jgi:hypothetical protein
MNIANGNTMRHKADILIGIRKRKSGSNGMPILTFSLGRPLISMEE